MPAPEPDRSDEPLEPIDEGDLSRSYRAVVVLWVVVLSGLFWLGRHFG